MKLIIAYVQPHKLQDVKKSLYKAEVFKLSVTNAMGCGAQKGYHESYRGVDVEVNLLKKVRLELGVPEEKIDACLEAILSSARTGKEGDGMIFIQELGKVVRVRTGEEGLS
jgi:nitrogen regulatory protein P-II 2